MKPHSRRSERSKATNRFKYRHVTAPVRISIGNGIIEMRGRSPASEIP